MWNCVFVDRTWLLFWPCIFPSNEGQVNSKGIFSEGKLQFATSDWVSIQKTMANSAQLHVNIHIHTLYCYHNLLVALLDTININNRLTHSLWYKSVSFIVAIPSENPRFFPQQIYALLTDVAQQQLWWNALPATINSPYVVWTTDLLFISLVFKPLDHGYFASYYG